MDPRGTDGWAIQEVYDRAFRRLFRDLKRQNDAGIDELICARIKNTLHRFVQDSRNTPGCSFSLAVVSDCDSIRQLYSEWNEFETRTDNSAIAGRSDVLDELYAIRNRVMKQLKRHSGGSIVSASQSDFAVIKQLFTEFKGLVDDFPDKFFYLKQSVVVFEGAVRRAGR